MIRLSVLQLSGLFCMYSNGSAFSVDSTCREIGFTQGSYASGKFKVRELSGNFMMLGKNEIIDKMSGNPPFQSCKSFNRCLVLKYLSCLIYENFGSGIVRVI